MIERRKQLAAESIQQRSDLNVQIYGLLTPEQKAKVPALIDEAKSKMQERRATHHDVAGILDR
jgi:Spy/CpxP family protein refolding chaperone